jgi:hypothetical protein
MHSAKNSRQLVERPLNSRPARPSRDSGSAIRRTWWIAALEPIVRPRANARLLNGHDISPYLVAADVMITDHSSVGFEYLLLDRPLIRIYRPALIEMANIHPDYVRLLGEAALSVDTLDQTLEAVDRALTDPADKSTTRQSVAADLFYQPGTATARGVAALYEAIGLDAHAAVPRVTEVACEPWA